MFAAKRAGRLVHDAERRPEILRTVETAMATLCNPGHTHAVRMLASGDLLAAAASIRRSVLIINGAEDIVTPPAGAKALYAALQKRPRELHIDERLQIIPAAGHAVYLEQTSAVIAAAAKFFEARP